MLVPPSDAMRMSDPDPVTSLMLDFAEAWISPELNTESFKERSPRYELACALNNHALDLAYDWGWLQVDDGTWYEYAEAMCNAMERRLSLEAAWHEAWSF